MAKTTAALRPICASALSKYRSTCSGAGTSAHSKVPRGPAASARSAGTSPRASGRRRTNLPCNVTGSIAIPMHLSTELVAHPGMERSVGARHGFRPVEGLRRVEPRRRPRPLHHREALVLRKLGPRSLPIESPGGVLQLLADLQLQPAALRRGEGALQPFRGSGAVQQPVPAVEARFLESVDSAAEDHLPRCDMEVYARRIVLLRAVPEQRRDVGLVGPLVARESGIAVQAIDAPADAGQEYQARHHVAQALDERAAPFQHGGHDLGVPDGAMRCEPVAVVVLREIAQEGKTALREPLERHRFSARAIAQQVEVILLAARLLRLLDRDPADDAVLVDDERASLGVPGLAEEDAVLLRHVPLRVEIGAQRRAQSLVALERAQAPSVVHGYADHRRALALVLHPAGPDLFQLLRTDGREGGGEEDDDDVAAAKAGKAGGLALLVEQLEIRGDVADLKHGSLPWIRASFAGFGRARKCAAVGRAGLLQFTTPVRSLGRMRPTFTAEPVATNGSPESRAKNRRVELRIATAKQ